MPKKSTKPRKQAQAPKIDKLPKQDAKISEKIKVQLEPNPYLSSEEKEPVKTYVDISKSAKDSKFLASTYGMTEEEQEALKATIDKVLSEYNNPKEYPMIYTGKTKSQWEKFRDMVNRRKPIQAITNWFKNIFK